MKKYKYFIIGGIVLALLAIALSVKATPVFYKIGQTIVKAYSTPEEFIADGGMPDFSNVQDLAIQTNEPVLGSVNQANEYQSTTTNYIASTSALLKTGPGSLGSVIIQGATTAGSIDLYNATTTNANLRAAKYSATSSIVIGSFMNTATLGTYTFDSIFFNGLLISIKGTLGTTTITWR